MGQALALQGQFYNNCQNSCVLIGSLVIAIVYKITDNKNDVGCNARTFTMENKANKLSSYFNSACTFSMLL